MKIFSWLFIIGIFLLVITMQRVQVKRIGAEVSVLKRDVSQKEAANKYMLFRIEELSSPARVYKEGEEKLQLRLTPAQNIKTLEEKK